MISNTGIKLGTTVITSKQKGIHFVEYNFYFMREDYVYIYCEI